MGWPVGGRARGGMLELLVACMRNRIRKMMMMMMMRVGRVRRVQECLGSIWCFCIGGRLAG